MCISLARFGRAAAVARPGSHLSPRSGDAEPSYRGCVSAWPGSVGPQQLLDRAATSALAASISYTGRVVRRFLLLPRKSRPASNLPPAASAWTLRYRTPAGLFGGFSCCPGSPDRLVTYRQPPLRGAALQYQRLPFSTRAPGSPPISPTPAGCAPATPSRPRCNTSGCRFQPGHQGLRLFRRRRRAAHRQHRLKADYRALSGYSCPTRRAHPQPTSTRSAQPRPPRSRPTIGPSAAIHVPPDVRIRSQHPRGRRNRDHRLQRGVCCEP